MSVTPGAIAGLKGGRVHGDGFCPNVIIRSVKSITTSAGSAPRYKLTLADNSETVQGMLNGTAVSNPDDLCEGAILRLDEFIVNMLAGQSVVIIVNYTVMGHGTVSAHDVKHAAPAAPVVPAANPYANPYAPAATSAPSANSRPISNDYNSAPVSNVVPISALNPYTNRWTIKARITSKTDVRTWSNAKGDGSLFSIDLLDNEGTAIRSTFFKAAVDRWFEVLEEGRVYYFSGGKLKPANAKFSNIKNNYEITFDERSEIKECFEGSDIKTQSYDFVSVLSINNKEPGDTIDLLAIVKSASDVSEIVSQKQNGKVLSKRDLTVTDDSGADIRVTVWGEKATHPPPYPYEEHPIIAFKGVRIGDFGGRTLSCTGSTSLAFNPNLPEAVQLHTWRQQFQDGVLPTGQNLSAQGREGGGSQDSLERRKTISMIKDENMGFGDKPDFISLKGSIAFIKHDNDPWYCACPTEGCNKKVFETVDNKWTCEKCNANFENCNRRYVMSVTMSDDSGQGWFSMFNETAEKLLGHTADELYNMKASSADGTSPEVEQIFADALFKDYVVKVKVKAEQVNDEQRVKSTVLNCSPLNYVQECNDLINMINKY